MRSTSIATRIGLVTLLVAMASLVVTAAVGLQHGSQLADELVQARLITTGASRGEQVERYVRGIQRQVKSLAFSPGTRDALDEFSAAFDELQASGVDGDAEAELTDFYRTEVVPGLEQARGQPVSVAPLVPVQPAAVHLQSDYVTVDEADPSLIDDAGDGSLWSSVHAELHPVFRAIADQAGFDDLYLIDASGAIVYTVGKRTDLATDLEVGPLSGSTLADVVDAALSAGTADSVAMADFAPYQASGDRPAAFVASPVLAESEVVGVLAARIGTDRINDIMTDGGRWNGLGETGETYLVGADDTMRSDARPFVEDPEAYLDAGTDDGRLTPDEARSIDAFGTTVTFQRIDERLSSRAGSGDTDVAEATNYMGDDVLRTSGPLQIDGVEWEVAAEVARWEVDQPVEKFARELLTAMAVFIVISTLLSAVWSNRLAEPLRALSTRLRRIRSGEKVEPSAGPGRRGGRPPTEYVQLSEDVDTMLVRLDERRAAVAARTTERVDLLRRFLPPALVRRAEAGDTGILDRIDNASVAVIVFKGLGDLVRDGSKEAVRDVLDRLVSDLDDLAEVHGLERVKLTGDTYVAACGTTRPYLDHAPRTVRFALAVADLIADVSAEEGHALSMSAGVDSGPVTVGLAGGAQLVYDAWGPTVTSAARLGRTGSAGQVLVSAAVRSTLPPGLVTVDVDHPPDGGDASVVRAAAGAEGGPR